MIPAVGKLTEYRCFAKVKTLTMERGCFKPQYEWAIIYVSQAIAIGRSRGWNPYVTVCCSTREFVSTSVGKSLLLSSHICIWSDIADELARENFWKVGTKV